MKLIILAGLATILAGCATFESSKPQNEPLMPPPGVFTTHSL